MNEPVDPQSHALPATKPPWGLLGTIAWGAFGICAWFAVQFAVVIAYLVWSDAATPGRVDMQKLAHDGFLLAFVTVMAGPAWIGASVIAARLRGWRARDYLALIPPRRSEIVFAVGCLAALLVGFDLFTYVIGRDVVPRFMIDAYRTARASNSLLLFFVAVVIVAPIAEEIAFRGFLFRGLSESWLGVSGTLIATSAVWAGMHIQYDAFTIGQIFCIGMLLGWIRWATGSTLLTIWLHVAANLVACVQAVIKVEWLS